MHNAVGYLAEDTTQPGVARAFLQVGTRTERYLLRAAIALRIYSVGQYLATTFSRLTIIVRVATMSLAVLTTLTVLVMAVARIQATPVIIDLPEAELRRTLTTTLAGCESLHDGYFRCTLNMDGNEVS